MRNHPEILPQLMARFMAFLNAQPDSSYYLGKLFVVDADRVRIRE